MTFQILAEDQLRLVREMDLGGSEDVEAQDDATRTELDVPPSVGPGERFDKARSAESRSSATTVEDGDRCDSHPAVARARQRR